MSLFELYIISVLPRIGCFLFFGGGILLAILVFCSIFKIIEDITPPPLKYYKLWLSIVFSLFFISTVIPSERQMYFIAGGYIVTNIDGIKDLPPNLVGAANDFLKNLSKENKKEEVVVEEGNKI